MVLNIEIIRTHFRKRQFRKRKSKLKLHISCLLSVLTFFGFCFLFIFKSNTNESMRISNHERHLTGAQNFLPDVFTVEQREKGALILHLFGMLYMFIGIAIACDEFFVPALEVIAEKLEWSDDVAGATLMAAGGSAPELFTSLIGTLIMRTDVGFGTIVGSAVFNVLFVIGMCALAAKEVLELTGWPLARDSTYYVISLCTLSLFFGVITPNKIYVWEAFFLLAMYFGYVYLMSKNHLIYQAWVNRKSSSSSVSEMTCEGTVENGEDEKRKSRGSSDILKRRLSLQKIVTGNTTVLAPVESHLKIFGVFLDNEDDVLEISKIKTMLQDAGHKGDMEKAFSDREDEKMPVKDFKSWYCDKIEKISKEVSNEFPKTSITRVELENGLKNLEIGCEKASDVATNFFHYLEKKELLSERNRREIFMHWYKLEFFLFYVCTDEIEFPSWPDNIREQFYYVITAPLMFPMYYSVPDAAKSNKHAAVAFFISILWIGVYSTLMVMWGDTFGTTIGLSPKALGLTFIAAGTSVPDLISSVIVARQGKGDMAVSSSIGSNIFDILVGLPIPWILGNIVYWEPVKVEATTQHNSLLFSITVLIIMLCATVLTIALSGWKMTKRLAGIMLILYSIFLVQDLFRAYGIWSSPY